MEICVMLKHNAMYGKLSTERSVNVLFYERQRKRKKACVCV